MLSYQEFLEDLDERAQLGGSDRARTTLEAVLGSVAGAVGADARRALADVLPGSLRSCIEQAPQAPAQDLGGLLGRVAERADVPRERARLQAHAVLSCLAQAEPDVAEGLRRDLPRAPGSCSPRLCRSRVPALLRRGRGS